VALAGISQGETVLDLGCGAGLDLLIAARLTGPSGKVIGVDMTPAMVERARSAAARLGFTHVEVREGVIESLPVSSSSVDLVISNCVLNLSPEKHRVFKEIARVLRAGGRFSVSDIVVEDMPSALKEDMALYSACVAGAVSEREYVEGLRRAGLVDVEVRERHEYSRSEIMAMIGTSEEDGCCGTTAVRSRAERERIADLLAGRVASIRVVGRKPAGAVPVE